MIYVAPALPEHAAMGRRVRRDGVRQGLVGRGLPVRTILVRGRWSRLPALLQMVPAALGVARALRLAGRRREPALVEGADTALAAALVVPLWGWLRPRIHVDACDSLVLLAAINSGGAGPRAALRRAAKRWLAGLAAAAVRTVADSVSYVSERDRAADEGRLGACRSVVVGLGRPAGRRSVQDPAGPFVVVGDWAYPPNAEMLRAVVAWLDGWGTDRAERLRIAGPNLTDVPGAPGLAHLGFVDDLADAYAGSACSLALLSDGAGVKNKVLDSLVMGVPVVGTPEAFNGIGTSPFTLEWSRDLTPADAMTWAASCATGSASTSLPTWEDVVEPIVADVGRESS